MTRKDYELIAKALRQEIDNTCPCNDCHVKRRMVKSLATVLKEDNPRFNPDKFIKACGLATLD